MKLPGKTAPCYNSNIDGLVQERWNSSALAIELHLSCTNPLICFLKAADDDAGKLQPVFLKRLYLLHICIFSFFSFHRKFNNHLKILSTTI